jgi:glycosyltransferase involved in cell wall biosynthesis
MSRAANVLLSVNAAWNIVNFRTGLVQRLLADGHQVTVAAPRDYFAPQIERLGCAFVDLPLSAHGRSPIGDAALFHRYLRIIGEVRPDVYLGFTAKPNIYGSLAAQAHGVPTINNIAGLGTVFNESGPTSWIVRGLYRTALRRAGLVFFQNPVDRALFVKQGIVKPAITALLPGSGVDLDRFRVATLSKTDTPFVFLLVARLLQEKGLVEVVEAARQLQREGTPVTLRLLGPSQKGNPIFVQPAQLKAWEAEGIATWLGETHDVRPHLAAADCVVLPSYYPEGTPRALLEAAAMGRPIITCDLPGCRDAVEHGISGYLVRPRDIADLAEHMRRMATLDRTALAMMGSAGRARIEQMFDERIVLDRYAKAIRAVITVRSH